MTTTTLTTRLAVGDACWHYQNGLLRKSTITRVSTTTLGDNSDYLLGYDLEDADPVDPTPRRFAPAGTVFARPEARAALTKRITMDRWVLQSYIDDLKREQHGDDQ